MTYIGTEYNGSQDIVDKFSIYVFGVFINSNINHVIDLNNLHLYGATIKKENL